MKRKILLLLSLVASLVLVLGLALWAIVAHAKREKMAMLRYLDPVPNAHTTIANMTNSLGFLPEEKKSRVMDTLVEYQAKMVKAFDGRGIPPRTVRKIQRSMETAISKLLSEDEALEYELRFSSTANHLRRSTLGFEPSKDEFIKLYQLRKVFDDKHLIFSGSRRTPEESELHRADEKLLEEAIKASLGDDRYAYYEMSQDSKYCQEYTSAKRSGLGVEEAKAAWKIRTAAENRASKIRKNMEFEKAARDAALAAIRTETETSLRRIYGERGLIYYRYGYGARWLHNLDKNE